MIFGDNREAVIKNIKKAANDRDFTAKVEIGDPQMSLDERLKLVNDYWENRKTFSSKTNKPFGIVTIEDFEGQGELALFGEEWTKWHLRGLS